MLTRADLKGVYVLLPTPFDRAGEFVESAFRENIRTLVNSGVHGVIATGGVGEFHTIQWSQHQRLLRALAEETSGTPVRSVAGCSGLNTAEAIERTTCAQENGLDAVMNVSPFYSKLTDAELVRFWMDLADACPQIGIIIYNNPTSAQLHTAAIYEELAKIPTVCGTKEGHQDFALLYHLLSRTNLSAMTSAERHFFVPSFRLGARGVISTSGAFAPKTALRMYHLCEGGAWSEAEVLQIELKKMWDRLDQIPMLRGYGSIATFKALVNAFGELEAGFTRAPFLSVPDDVQRRLSEFVRGPLREEFPLLLP